MAKRAGTTDDRGYVMVVLLMGMAIAAVWMAATLPAWRQQSVRQKEEELIFRGQQYARAIGLFYRKNNRTLPSDIDTLVSGKYLRKKWKDPITNDDFALVGQVAQPTAGARPGGGPGTSGTSGTSGTPSRGGTPTTTTPSRGGTPTGSSAPSPFGASGGQNGVGGITGVASKSTDTSIKIYQNQQQYNLWQFTLTTAGINLGNQQGQGQGPGRGGPGGGGPPGGQQVRPGAPGGPGGRGPGGPGGGPPPPPAPGGRGRGMKPTY